MRIVWEDAENLPIFCGHGVEFHASGKQEGESLFAFLEGYQWLHESPDEVVILIRKADSQFNQQFLNLAKETIEGALASGQLHNGKLNAQIHAWFNA